MNSLLDKIKARLAQKAILPFSEYMAWCLFDTDYGYYSHLQAIGAEGDFITAPELGPYFAQALAHFLQPWLQQNPMAVIVELGGGTGQLAFDLLVALKAQDSLPIRYLIIEKSPSLRNLQQQKLNRLEQALRDRIEWHTELQENNLTGVLLANEFFDALPVERFIKTAIGLQRLGVAWQQDHLLEVIMPDPLRLPKAAKTLQSLLTNLPEGYRSEFCAVLQPTLTSFLYCFKKGISLVIDYGDEAQYYYDRRRHQGTIAGYQNHQAVSLFTQPGQCDLTAHVDFTYLAECFVASGWQIDAFKTQAQFLLEQNILPQTGLTVENYSLKRLLDSRLMGNLFKVLVASFE